MDSFDPMIAAPPDPSFYQARLKEQFTLRAENGSATVTLASVEEKIDDDIQRCFVVHFTGIRPVLPQGIYRVSGTSVADFDLFVVPIQTRRNEALYEAAFNQLKETPAT